MFVYRAVLKYSITCLRGLRKCYAATNFFGVKEYYKKYNESKYMQSFLLSKHKQKIIFNYCQFYYDIFLYIFFYRRK